MPEKIVECSRCGKEICVTVEVLDDIVFIKQKDTLEESIDFIMNHPDLKIGKVDPRLKGFGDERIRDIDCKGCHGFGWIYSVLLGLIKCTYCFRSSN